MSDTFSIFNDLEAAFERPQAEAIVKAMAARELRAGLATKSDIERLEAEIKHLATSLELKITYRMITVMGGMMALFTALEHFVFR